MFWAEEIIPDGNSNPQKQVGRTRVTKERRGRQRMVHVSIGHW
jgi:hypothetical protein